MSKLERRAALLARLTREAALIAASARWALDPDDDQTPTYNAQRAIDYAEACVDLAKQFKAALEVEP